MTYKWNPLLPDKTRSGGWGSSFNAIKEHLKLTPWSRVLTLILRSQLSKKLCICGMYRTSLHWSSAWESERKQTCHYLTTRSRKIMEGSRTHTRAQNCQNEREIHGRKKPKSSFLGGEKQIVQIICCASSNLFSLALCSSVSSMQNTFLFACLWFQEGILNNPLML